MSIDRSTQLANAYGRYAEALGIPVSAGENQFPSTLSSGRSPSPAELGIDSPDQGHYFFGKLSPHLHKIRGHFERCWQQSDRSSVSDCIALALESHFGLIVPARNNAVMYLGMASIMMQRLTCHELHTDAVDVIDRTDVHSLPSTPPTLFRQRSVVVDSSGYKAIAHDLVSVGACAYRRDEWVIFGSTEDGQIIAGGWKPQWGQSIEKATDAGYYGDLLSDNPSVHKTRISAAARLLVVLSMLLEAENTPLISREKPQAPSGSKRSNRQRRDQEWTVKHIYLDPTKRPTRETSASTAGHDSGSQLAVVPVTGHLKHQPCGKNGEDRKLIYVEGYSARRWVSPTPRKVVVHG